MSPVHPLKTVTYVTGPYTFTKGGLQTGYLTGRQLSSPFAKGGPRPARHRSRSGEAGGGILLRARPSLSNISNVFFQRVKPFNHLGGILLYELDLV